MENQIIKISKIKSNTGQIDGLPKNPRIFKDDRYKKLLNSIKEDPEMLNLRELLVYPLGKEFIVIAGNMRLKACKELGFEELNCKVLDADTTVAKLKAYTIKDNVSFGEHDFEMLQEEWDVLDLENWGIEIQKENHVDLDKFFEESNETKDKKKIIVLQYTEEHYNKVIEALSKHNASNEQVVYKLLGL